MQRKAFTHWFMIGVVATAVALAGCSGEQSKEEEDVSSQPELMAQVDSAYGPDSLPIYYEVHGQGGQGDTALMFVHGWGLHGGYWENQVEVFDDSFRVVTMDMAGHGRSGDQREAWTVESLAADVVAVLEGAGIENAVLIGHSMGGMVIAKAATLAPERVVALIGIDNFQDFAHRWTEEQGEEFLAPFHENYDSSVAWFVGVMLPEDVDPSVRERIIAEFQAGDPETRIATLANVFRYDLGSTMEQVTVPVRAISSDSYPTNVEGNRKLAPSFDVKLMSGVGHFPFMEKPEEFNRLLGETLAELRAAPTAQ